MGFFNLVLNNPNTIKSGTHNLAQESVEKVLNLDGYYLVK